MEAEAWAVTAGGTAGVAKAGEVARTAVRRETRRLESGRKQTTDTDTERHSTLVGGAGQEGKQPPKKGGGRAQKPTTDVSSDRGVKTHVA